MIDTIKLLLISAGSLVGQNIIQAIGPRRSLFHLEATNSEPAEPSLADFDAVRIVPPTSVDTTGLDRLLNARLDQGSCRLVIPCRDEEVLWLARHRETHPGHGDRLLVGSAATAEIFLDKLLSWDFSRDNGLPFLPSVDLQDTSKLDRFARENPFPLIVKPRKGFASRGVWILTHPDQLEAHRHRSDVILQPYCGDTHSAASFLSDVQHRGLPLFHSFEETKHSIQTFITPSGELAGTFVTLHRMKRGVSREVVPSACQQAHDLGQRVGRVFASAGWRGPLNIQCHREGLDDYRIYEYNGRFTGATAARALLGFDELALALASFAGIHLPPLPNRHGAAVKQPFTRGTLPPLSPAP
ncbi:hypothetical protein [Synechococcus sp. CCY 9618]|uniref:hypothetical protein n=1 Tax=Synechococcus sp. CCY 9618 TaxID=2815602 RepID=UPI001C21B1E3|nr:hypothetical protein [Synechococcus sp. CCY 9618]